MATKATEQKTQDTGTSTQKKPGGEESGSTQAAQPTGKKGEDGAQEANTGGKDAVELIKQDHRSVEKLFEQFKQARNVNQKRRVVAQICRELTIHAMIEEQIFYPACRGKVEDDLLDEAQVEHDGAKELIVELQQGAPSDPFYDAKVTVLSEYIKHHVAEEEKSGDGILDAARKAGVDMAALGKEIEAQRPALEDEAASTKVPDMPSRTVGDAAHRKEDNMAQAYGNDRGRDGRSGNGGRSSSGGRDENGRFTSGNNRGGRDDDDNRRYSSQSRDSGRSSSRYDEDDRGGSSRGQGGWFGDSEGHSRASRMGWEDRDRGGRDDDGRYSSQSSSRGRSSRDDDDDRGGRDRSQGDWFGDSEGHAEAARRGWDDRGRGGRDDDGDDRRYSSSRSGGGWRSRDDDDDRRYASSRSGGGSSRYRDDDVDDRGRGRGHGGWFGDSEGHAEAARRSWQDR